MEQAKDNITIQCKYEDKSFTIKIPKVESLLNLKHYIVKELSTFKIFTYDTNISIRYGFPPKLISDSSNDTKTLPELSIGNNECLRVELIDPKCIRASENEIIDYSKHRIKKKSIPADNCCLFNAINYAMNQSITEPEVIRSIISMVILDNPTEYNKAVLEKDPEDYCEWIMRGDSWGGGIEIAILSKYFMLNIGVVDIKNLTIEYFGNNYSNTIYLLYDNVHYDVFYYETDDKKITGVFKSDDTKAKDEILEIAAELKRHKQYVDTQNYSIKCMECNFLMKGNDDVIEHSKKTGHTNFNQI